jgi:hypothetical protein
MLEKVYLHIGTPKTGTSAIQSHLSQNRKRLLSQGVLYPVTISSHRGIYKNSESHHLLTYSWAGTAAVSGWTNFTIFNPEYFFDRVERFCKTQVIPKMVLSAENTYWLPYLLNVKDFVEDEKYWEHKTKYVKKIKQSLNNYDTKIIIYLRRQDHWIQSWFNQHVKNGFPLPKDIEKFSKQSKSLLDYKAHLDLYADFFGKENIIVRVYEKEQLNEGLFNDFLHCIGIENASEYKLKEKPKYNTQLPREMLEFLNICNHLPIDQDTKNRLKFLARKVTMQFEENMVFIEQKLLSPSQRLSLIDQYAEKNAEIAKVYLGRTDSTLFYEPMPADDDSDWKAFPGLSVENAIDILMRIFLTENVAQMQRTRKKEKIKDDIYHLINKLPLSRPYHKWKEDKIFINYLGS